MGLLSKLFGSSNAKTEVKSPSFEVITRDDVPALQGDYAKAIFLWACGKSTPVRGKDDYSRYFLTECGIQNVPAYHRDMIKQGYLEKDDEAKSLQNLKVAELKSLLTSLDLPVTGKKDALIQRILDSGKAAEVLKQYPETYSLSTVGADFLSAHDDYVQLHRHKVWDISWQEYDAKHKQGQSFNDTAWGILNARAVKDTRLFGRVEYYFMYEILHDEGRRADAIQMLLRVLYLDLSGVSGIPSYDMCRRKIISKKDLAEHFEANFILAPGIIEPIAGYRDVYTDEMVDKLFAWKLPVQVCSKKTFLKLVHAALEGNFDTTEVKKALSAEYASFIKHL